MIFLAGSHCGHSLKSTAPPEIRNDCTRRNVSQQAATPTLSCVHHSDVLYDPMVEIGSSVCLLVDIIAVGSLNTAPLSILLPHGPSPDPNILSHLMLDSMRPESIPVPHPLV